MNFQYSFIIGGIYLILSYITDIFAGSGVEYIKGFLFILLVILNIRSLFPSLVASVSKFAQKHPAVSGYLSIIGWLPYPAIFVEIIFMILNSTGIYAVPESWYSVLTYSVVILVFASLIYQTYRVSDSFKFKTKKNSKK